AVALCQLDRTNGSWKTLRTVAHFGRAWTDPKPYFSFREVAKPLVTTAVAACPELLCFAAGPIIDPQSPALYLYDRRLHVWRDIAFDPKVFEERHALNITFLE